MNELVYAAHLRRSAIETARRIRTGGLAEETRSWGTLKAAILEELDDCPKPASEIAARFGKDNSSVSAVLNRLEQQGHAVRSGMTRGRNGQAIITWLGRSLV